jgi:hypothetical protein
MTRGTDFGTKYAAKFQTQLNTVAADLYGGANTVTVGAGDQMLFDSLDITSTPGYYEDASTNGTQIATGKLISEKPVGIAGATKIYTYGMERMLVAAVGYCRLDAPATDGVSFCHLLALPPNGKDQRAYTSAEASLAGVGYDADDRINAYMTMVKSDGGPVDFIAKNVSIKSFSLKAESKGPLMLEFNGTAETEVRDATKAARAAVTIASGTQDAFYMLRDFRTAGGVTGVMIGPPASMEAVAALSFAVNVDFGQAENMVPTGTSNDGLAQAEPVATGMTKVTIEVKRYLYDTDNPKTWEQAGTEIAFSAEAVKGLRGFGIAIRSMRIDAVEIDRADGGSITITATAYVPTATSAEFTAFRTFDAVELDNPNDSVMLVKIISPEDTNQLRAV